MSSVLIISMKMMNLENLSSKDILKLLPRHFLPDGLLEKEFCGGWTIKTNSYPVLFKELILLMNSQPGLPVRQ